MARKRSIDPNIWDSETLGSLSHSHRLLFIGLFSNADDDGRFKASAKRVRKVVFPYDTLTTDQDVENWLCDLTQCELIHRWKNGKDVYGELPTWHDYQKVRYPSESQLPTYKGEPQTLHEACGSADVALTQGCGSVDVKEERRELRGEERREERKEHPPVKKVDRGGIIPPAWPDQMKNVPEEWRKTIKQPQNFLNSAKVACPNITISDEINNAIAWIVANPKREKKEWGRFLMGWFRTAEKNAREGRGPVGGGLENPDYIPRSLRGKQ